MRRCHIEMKMINPQTAEFKETLKIKVKNDAACYCRFVEISLQHLKMVCACTHP